ncbi:hypothetical protein BYT27DRAFT_7205636 [Phlegmacium glaucopus]|nr:hypothetical protein BYT27DRAFT_7205636 [Phlegmacium glaucopus]
MDNTITTSSLPVEETVSKSSLDKVQQEGASTSTPADSEPCDASKSSTSNQSKEDPVFLTELISLPPPPRKKLGVMLILPADDTKSLSTGTSDPKSPTLSSSKTHVRTNTFGTIHNEKFGL